MFNPLRRLFAPITADELRRALVAQSEVAAIEHLCEAERLEVAAANHRMIAEMHAERASTLHVPVLFSDVATALRGLA